MRKGEHSSKPPRIGHFCTNNGRVWCDFVEFKWGFLTHGIMNVRYDLS